MIVLDNENVKQFSYRQLCYHPRFATTWNTSLSDDMIQMFQGVGKGDQKAQCVIEEDGWIYVLEFCDK